MRLPRRSILCLTCCALASCGGAGGGGGGGTGVGAARTSSGVVTATALSARLRHLGLTHRDPPTYHAACAKLRSRVGQNLCPTLVPGGALHVNFALPLRGYPRTVGIDLGSPGLTTSNGRRVPAAGGHWTITATSSPQGHELFRFYLQPDSADRPSACSSEQLGPQVVTVCNIPAHEHGGGYYAGHVAAEWDAGGTVGVQLGAHGYASRDRVLAMLASIIQAGRR